MLSKFHEICVSDFCSENFDTHSRTRLAAPETISAMLTPVIFPLKNLGQKLSRNIQFRHLRPPTSHSLRQVPISRFHGVFSWAAQHDYGVASLSAKCPTCGEKITCGLVFGSCHVVSRYARSLDRRLLQKQRSTISTEVTKRVPWIKHGIPKYLARQNVSVSWKYKHMSNGCVSTPRSTVEV